MIAIFDDTTTLGLSTVFGLVAIFDLEAIFDGVTILGLTTIGDFSITILGVLIMFLVASTLKLFSKDFIFLLLDTYLLDPILLIAPFLFYLSFYLLFFYYR